MGNTTRMVDNTTNIRAMTTIELDNAIAIDIMGWRSYTHMSGWCVWQDTGLYVYDHYEAEYPLAEDCWQPSQNLTQAWIAEEYLLGQGEPLNKDNILHTWRLARYREALQCICNFQYWDVHATARQRCEAMLLFKRLAD